MAAKSYYQYETSPKKQDYTYSTKKTQSIEKQKSKKTNLQKPKQKVKNKTAVRAKTVFYICICFGVLFAIGYRDSQINEKFVEVQDLKTELAAVQKETDQLEVTIENNLNLSSLEEAAKEQLGMQKLDNKQKVYVNLSKKDFVENVVEKVETKGTNIFDELFQIIKNIW